jgi:ribosomal protein S18 acetylase RimI-like enzyme
MQGIHVELLNHRDREVAQRIHVIQMVAYEHEAHMLGVTNFPPLRRTVEDIERSADRFFGARLESIWAGAIAIAEVELGGELEISSLVVLPEFHRRGIGRALLVAITSSFGDHTLTVSTGALNQPALELYAGFGFVEIRRYLSEDGAIALVKLRRPNGSSDKVKLAP